MKTGGGDFPSFVIFNMMKRVFFNPDKCECWDCHKTFPYWGVESPMLKNEIWKQIAADEPEVKYYTKDGDTWVGGGYLCKDCIEKRLGRSIEFEDLMTFDDGSPVPFNIQYIKKYFPDKL